MTFETYLENFHKLQHDYIAAEHAVQIVSWDWRAITPKKASSARADVIGYVSAKQNDLLCSKEMRETLEYLSSHDDMLSEIDRACVRELKRRCDRAVLVPSDLFEEFSVLQGRSEAAWEVAKRTDDWELYKPHLKNMFEYSRRMMDYWGYEGSPYNAMLDLREEGMTVERLDGLFSEMKGGVVPLVKAVMDSNVVIDDGFTKNIFPVDQQRQMADMLLGCIGFDKTRGLIAESEHPYTCSFGLDDVRLTSHYYDTQFLPAVFSTLHEGGHGLYEQGYDRQLDGTVIGCGLASAMHESVSRFWENIVGRSRAFWDYMLPRLADIFPKQLEGVTPEQMYRAVNKSGRSLLRIEADELNYNLHILLRYELERDVFEGREQVEDLPRLWNEKMQEYVGMTPPDNRSGILQDIQWSWGQFGYFPSYSLGNMYNAQYSSVLKKELPFDELLAKGDFAAIYAWMQKNIYRFGSLHTPDELIVQISGEKLSAKYLIAHLTEKFSALYHL